MAKESKNTARYDADPTNDSVAIDSIYLKEFALNRERPETIEVIVQFNQ